MHTSGTFWEVTAPVKLPLISCFTKFSKILVKEWYLKNAKCSHLFCTKIKILQLKDIVKVHGVFPSSCYKLASSRVIQIHQVYIGDSREVVIPFMQVGTYPTRNFATFGPSELQPPFTGDSFVCVHNRISPCSTGQVSASIHHI